MGPGKVILIGSGNTHYCQTIGTIILASDLTITQNTSTTQISIGCERLKTTSTITISNHPILESNTAPSKKLLQEIHKSNIRRGWKR